jgi:hypothetical protein
MALNALTLSIYLYLLGSLCGLVVSAPGYRSTGPGLDSRHCQTFLEVMFLEWGPLSL